MTGVQTCALPISRAFERLPLGRVKPALALSLHTTRAELREQLLPRAPRLRPDELVEAAEVYARRTGYPVQLQWTLLAGINDGDDEIEGLVRLLTGKFMVLNLIPYNAVPGLSYQRPSWEHAAEMARKLHRRGVLTKLRHSAGQDVDGGCGQLRSRVLGADAATAAATADVSPDGSLDDANAKAGEAPSSIAPASVVAPVRWHGRGEAGLQSGNPALLR